MLLSPAQKPHTGGHRSSEDACPLASVPIHWAPGRGGPVVEAVTCKASEGTFISEHLSWWSRSPKPPSSSPGRSRKLLRFQAWHACPRLSAPRSILSCTRILKPRRD